jgi:hypothetical protein
MKTVYKILFSCGFLVSLPLWGIAQPVQHTADICQRWSQEQNTKLSKNIQAYYEEVVSPIFRPDEPTHFEEVQLDLKKAADFGVPSQSVTNQVLLTGLYQVDVQGQNLLIAEYEKTNEETNSSTSVYLKKEKGLQYLVGAEGNTDTEVIQLGPQGPPLIVVGYWYGGVGWGKKYYELKPDGTSVQVLDVSVDEPSSFIVYKDLEGDGNLEVISQGLGYPDDALRDQLEKTDDFDETNANLRQVIIQKWNGTKFVSWGDYFWVDSDVTVSVPQDQQLDEAHLQIIRAVQSNPLIVDYFNEILDKGKEGVVSFESFHWEAEPLKKDQFDVYVGEKGEERQKASLSAACRFDFFTGSGKLVVTKSDEKTGQLTTEEGEYNRLIFADLTVDSSYPGYDPAPLTDCLFFKQTGKGLEWRQATWDMPDNATKDGIAMSSDKVLGLILTPDDKPLPARKLAWASSETNQDHWIKAAFLKPKVLQKVKVYWAMDKGLFYKSRKVHLFYKDETGQEKEIIASKTDSDPGMTTWEFKPVTTTEIILRQESGGGAPNRPNVMWVGQIWAY